MNNDTVFFTDTEVDKMEKITTMKSYLVPVVYQMYGYVTIDANSIEDAIKKVEDSDVPLPQDANYVEGSFEVDREGIDFAN